MRGGGGRVESLVEALVETLVEALVDFTTPDDAFQLKTREKQDVDSHSQSRQEVGGALQEVRTGEQPRPTTPRHRPPPTPPPPPTSTQSLRKLHNTHLCWNVYIFCHWAGCRHRYTLQPSVKLQTLKYSRKRRSRFEEHQNKRVGCVKPSLHHINSCVSISVQTAVTCNVCCNGGNGSLPSSPRHLLLVLLLPLPLVQQCQGSSVPPHLVPVWSPISSLASHWVSLLPPVVPVVPVAPVDTSWPGGE